MALHNYEDDQKERSWGDRLAKFFNMEPKKPKKLTAEEAVKLLQSRGGRA